MDPTVYDYGYETTTTVADTGALAAIMGFFAAYSLVVLLITIFYVVCMWKIFTKAGKPGWASLIPIYNIIVLLEIVGKPVWWIILFFVPVANLVVAILIYLELATKFGKSAMFAIFGLLLFPIVGFPILAFGSAQYQGTKAAAPAATAETPAPAA